jgi:B9 domain-containing protein 1
MEEVQKSCFLLNVTGEVSSGSFPGISNLYCKYCFVWGSDWGVVAGTEEGWSQTAKKVLDGEEDMIWNLPLDISFRSTNPQASDKLAII